MYLCNHSYIKKQKLSSTQKPPCDSQSLLLWVTSILASIPTEYVCPYSSYCLQSVWFLLPPTLWNRQLPLGGHFPQGLGSVLRLVVWVLRSLLPSVSAEMGVAHVGLPQCLSRSTALRGDRLSQQPAPESLAGPSPAGITSTQTLLGGRLVSAGGYAAVQLLGQEDVGGGGRGAGKGVTGT